MRTEIAKYTGITQDEYAEMIFDGGMEYNTKYLFGSEITHHRAYWEWFKNEWRRADDKFIDVVQAVDAVEYDTLKAYVSFHDNWMNGKFPSSVMIHRIIKQTMRKEACNG